MEKKFKSLVRGELIGLKIKVVDASNPALVGKEGEVVDETKDLLVIKKDDTTIKLIKDQITLKIGDEVVPGLMLCARPEERIKITSKKINTIKRLVKRNARENKNKESRIQH
jgi:ribonuclease P protein subunit POP4